MFIQRKVYKVLSCLGLYPTNGLIGKCNFSQLLKDKKKVLVFGGQGSQEKGMLQKYLSNKESLNLIRSQAQKLKVDFLEIGTTDANNLINQTQYTQPLLLLSHYLQFYHQKKIQQNQKLNLQNTFCIGHSLGEYSALMIAGSISLQECLRLVYTRGELMMKASQGRNFGSLIIKYRQDKQKGILSYAQMLGLQVAGYNSPTNMVVSGELEKINQLKSLLKEKLRIASKLLPVSTAFHCKYLSQMQKQFLYHLNAVNWSTPKYEIIRNIDGKLYLSKDDIVQGLSLQNTRPVLFMQSVKKLIQREGVQNLDFIQIGQKEYLDRWIQQVRKLTKSE